MLMPVVRIARTRSLESASSTVRPPRHDTTAPSVAGAGPGGRDQCREYDEPSERAGADERHSGRLYARWARRSASLRIAALRSRFERADRPPAAQRTCRARVVASRSRAGRSSSPDRRCAELGEDAARRGRHEVGSPLAVWALFAVTTHDPLDDVLLVNKRRSNDGVSLQLTNLYI